MSNKKTTKKNTNKKTKTTSNSKVKVEEKVLKHEVKLEEKNSKVNVKEQKLNKAKKKNFLRGFLISLLCLIACSVSLIPLFKETKFGLDLQGGFEILYSIKSIDGSEVTDEMVDATRVIIEKRINALGVNEPEILIEGDNIRIQLAGVTDEKEAKSVLSQMANLTFRNSDDELVMSSSVLKPGSVKVAQDERNMNNYYLILEIDDVDTFHEQTEIIRQNNDVMVIWLDFEEGIDTFEKEQQNCGTSSDSRCISYASIDGELTGSTVTLTGNFTYEEAKTLADLINSGSLPTKLEELSSKTVNASFGEDALQKTFFAGVVGISLIALLLIIVYRFSGLIASIGIVAYTALVFLIFNLIGGRLTLSGVAAVIIGIGMAG